MIRLTVNEQPLELEIDPQTPMLWVLRDHLNLTGTKYGCGIGMCGACKVLVNDQAVNACTLTAADAAKFAITTIEGLSTDGSHPVQRAWIEEDVPQCGYCQSGQILTAVALLRATSQPSDADIDAAMTGICRCGTYPRIRRAVHSASQKRSS